MEPINTYILQTNSVRSVDANVNRFSSIFKKLKQPDLLVLPEVFAIRGNDDDYRQAAENIGTGKISQWCSEIARHYNCWLLAGSIIERADKKIYNTAVLFDRYGKIKATYRKMHLFEAHLEDGRVIKESDVFFRGIKPVLKTVENWKCGFSICYDVRFPELYRLYAFKGAQILFVPANFTQRTGKDHWEVLIKARAIENQAFVVAANQCGKNEATGVASYGHSIIVGPWGDVLAEADGENEMLIQAVLKPSLLLGVRARIPCLKHSISTIAIKAKKC